jgi:hypothetical protein
VHFHAQHYQAVRFFRWHIAPPMVVYGLDAQQDIIDIRISYSLLIKILFKPSFSKLDSIKR